MSFAFYQILKRCYRLAMPYGRWKLFSVLGLVLFNGLLQLGGVTSIFPFFALAAEPDRIRNSSFGKLFLSFLPPLSTNSLIVVAGVFAIAMLVIASVSSLLSEYWRIRYAYGLAHWIRGRLMKSYAARPYSFFLSRNSSELVQRIADLEVMTQSVLLPIGEILTRVVLIGLLIGAMVLVQPLIALGGLLIFGGYYLCAYKWLRPKTRLTAEKLEFHTVQFTKSKHQFLQGIKPVMVHGKSGYFVGKALEHAGIVGRFYGKLPVYSNGPRYLIEPIAFGGLAAVVVTLALQGRPFSDVLPNLSVMALAGHRLLSSFQLLFGQLVYVASNQYVVSHVEKEIAVLDSVNHPEKDEPLSFEREIRFEKVGFRYPQAAAPVFNGLDMSIQKNEWLGVAGPSGGGKSTLVDLLLGLLTPQSGSILVDDVAITAENAGSWRQLVGYVPQDIFLLDESVAANIAFGIDPADVDIERVRQAAQSAQILEFVEKELPNGFDTVVGERGVRLSGGQRQRIGLARALYHKPSVLVLDEATSALDHKTEAAVMETIHALQGKLTIVTVAHRLSTLEKCDRVIRIEKGAGRD